MLNIRVVCNKDEVEDTKPQLLITYQNWTCLIKLSHKRINLIKDRFMLFLWTNYENFIGNSN